MTPMVENSLISRNVIWSAPIYKHLGVDLILS